MSNSWSCSCSVQSRNLRHLEIALRILRIPKLRANLEIARWVLVRGTVAQSRDRDSAISVACTIEPFEFPSHIKVRDVRNKLLQLRRHLQCQAVYSNPRTRGFWDVHQLGETPFPSVWVREQRDPRPVECPVQGITISESSQLSSVSQLVRSHPVSPLRSQIVLAQSRDCTNVLRNSEIAQTNRTVSRLAAQSQDWHAISRF